MSHQAADPHSDPSSRTAGGRIDFLHGADYPNTTGIPRDSCCASCAFRTGPGTVRPDGTLPDDVWWETSGCDDFVCHVQNEDGSYPSCAGWHARMAQMQKGEA